VKKFDIFKQLVEKKKLKKKFLQGMLALV